MRTSKKQPTPKKKKRVYVKRSLKWTKEDTRKALENIQLLEPPMQAVKRDTEIQELTAVVSIFDNWTDDQKTRNIRFLASKYWEYLKD